MDQSKPRIYTITSKTFLNFYKLVFEHPEWVAFIVIFGTTLGLNLHRNDFKFYFDSAVYWNVLAKAFEDPITGTFSLLNFNSALRGYLLPLILFIIIKFSVILRIRSLFLLEITQSFVFSGLITVIIPYVIKKLFKHELKFWQILLFSLLVIFFWQGYFFYPLSDFWALSFLVFGMYLLLYYQSNKWALLLAGVVFGGAAVIRPSYSITIIFLLFWSAYYFLRYRNQTKRQILANELTITIGLAFVFLPQVIINMAQFGMLSPMPLTQVHRNNLFLAQLTAGIQVQRYETFVGLKSDYPYAIVIYLDEHGRNIFVRSGYDPDSIFHPKPKILSLSEYILLTLKHPLDFLMIYFRHLFNGLDVVYNTPYIYDLYENAGYIRLLNYSLLFLAILYINKHVKVSSVLSYQFLLLLILVLPSILSIPTGIEVRFLLPLHLISYSITAFFVLPMFSSFAGKKKISILLKYLPWYSIFIIICFLLSANTFANMRGGSYIFW